MNHLSWVEDLFNVGLLGSRQTLPEPSSWLEEDVFNEVDADDDDDVNDVNDDDDDNDDDDGKKYR